MGKIYYVDSNFDMMQLNLSDNDVISTNDFVMIKLVEAPHISVCTGKGKGNIYEVIISKSTDGWEYRVMDFITYNSDYDKNIIVNINQDELTMARGIYKGHTYKDKSLRYYEPKVLVHSTTLNSWKNIKNSRTLKSWNILQSERKHFESLPIGSLLGDPEDLRDYVMLGTGVTGEIVVASKQKNRIETNIDYEYEPGVRMYFDSEKIAQDGILFRDGAHMKVKDTLDLDKYLLLAVDKASLNISSDKVTPREFAKMADEFFKNHMDKIQSCTS